MKALDRYLLREFFAPLALVVLGIAGLVLLVEIVDTLPRLRDWGASASLIFLYHLTRIPFLLTQAIPLGVMLAALLSLGALTRNSELAAARAGGISPARLALPLLLAACGLSLLLFAASELLVPKATYYSRYIQKVLIEKRDLYFDVPWRNHMSKSLSGERQLYCREYDAQLGIMQNVVLIRREGLRIASRLDARRMTWNPQAGWVLWEGIERTFDPNGVEITLRPFQSWKAEIQETPADFMVDSDKREQELVQLPIAELKRLIAVLHQTGADFRKERVCLHLRISFPFSCLILTLLGVSLPFLFQSSRRSLVGAALGFLVSLGMGMLYLAFIQVGLSLGKAGVLPAVLSAWIANVVFLFMGTWALWRANR